MSAAATISLAFSIRPNELDPINAPGHAAGMVSSDQFLFDVQQGEAVLHRVFYPEYSDYNFAGTAGPNDSQKLENFPALQNTGPLTDVAVQDAFGRPISFVSLRLIALEIKARHPYLGTKATGLLTSSNSEVADGETVTIGSVVYRFKNTLAAINDVKRSGVVDTTLANLRAAINASGTPGTEYFTGTVVHPTVSAGAVDAHTVPLTARDYGDAGNAIATTDTSGQLSFSAVTLTGGSETSYPLVPRGIEGRVKVNLTSDILPGSSSSFAAEYSAPGLFIFASAEAWTPGSAGRFTVTFDTTEQSPKTDQDVNAIATLILIGTP